MQFLYSIWKILHLTEYFYTGTAHGARDNYEVWEVGHPLEGEVEAGIQVDDHHRNPNIK